MTVKCEKCGNPMFAVYGGAVSTTLVAYMSPPGHNHDDNCRTKGYECSCGYTTTVSIRNKCPNPTCDWIGKETCFCHEGKKIDEWPDE